MSPIRSPLPQFWLWVAHSESYLDHDGQDRADLEPGYESEDDWWTCDEATRPGDLAFLWRTKPRSDIGYLFQATSDPYDVPSDVQVLRPNWLHRCDFQVLQRFDNPLPIAQLRRARSLRGWLAYRCNFQRTVFPIEPAYWDILNQMLLRNNPSYRIVLRKLGFKYGAVAKSGNDTTHPPRRTVRR